VHPPLWYRHAGSLVNGRRTLKKKKKKKKKKKNPLAPQTPYKVQGSSNPVLEEFEVYATMK